MPHDARVLARAARARARERGEPYTVARQAVLAIRQDGIQLLGNDEAVQEEFFRTFSTVCNAGRQVVITSDRAPRHLASLDGRLRAQLE
jgi:chromosomal replication initiator protein